MKPPKLMDRIGEVGKEAQPSPPPPPKAKPIPERPQPAAPLFGAAPISLGGATSITCMVLKFKNAQSLDERRFKLVSLVVTLAFSILTLYYVTSKSAGAAVTGVSQVFLDFVPAIVMLGIAVAQGAETWLYVCRRHIVKSGLDAERQLGSQVSAFTDLREENFFSVYRYTLVYLLLTILAAIPLIMRVLSRLLDG